VRCFSFRFLYSFRTC